MPIRGADHLHERQLRLGLWCAEAHVDGRAGRGRLELDRVEHPKRSTGTREDRPVGHVVVRSPVEDLLEDGVLAMHAMVGRAGASPAARGSLDGHLGHPRLPGHALSGLRQKSPGDLRRHIGRDADGHEGFLGRHEDAGA